MEWLLGLVGAAIVVAVLIDIVNTVARPEARGILSRRLLAALWRSSRRRRFSGPLAMGGVIGVWGLLAVLGWAMIYSANLPDGFSGVAANRPDGAEPWLDAAYISLVTISTLGLGDVYPTSDLMRLVNPLQGLFGFGLLTAVVSWVLEVYPALARRKAFAIRLTLLRRAGTESALPEFGTDVAARLLDDVSMSVVTICVDLSDSPETYYFRTDEGPASLPANILYAAELGRAGMASPHAEVRHAGGVLLSALEEFAAVLDERFLHGGGDMAEIFAAYAVDHRQSAGT